MLKLKFLITIVIFFVGSRGYAQEKIQFSAEEQEWIKEHPIVQYGYDPNWPPFEMYDNGEYTGIIAEYVKVIEESTGIDLQPIEVNSFEETLDKLKSGEIHIAPEVGRNNIRDKFLDYTEVYLTDPQVIVTRYDAGFVGGIEDLKGKTISQPAGYVRIKKLKKIDSSLKIITTKNVKGSLRDVTTGKADAFIGSLSVVSYYISDLGYSSLKIAGTKEIGDIKFRLAVTKDWSIFRDIAQKVFESITKEEHAEIRNKWITIRYDHGIDKRDVWTYIFYGVIAFLLLILFFYLWNKTLRKQIKHREIVEKKLRLTLNLVHEKNKEKDILLKEIHHRVKNNLQMIHSLFNMQSRQVNNEYTREILSQGKTRIKAISLVHQLLYQSDNFDDINIQEYINSLIENVTSIYKSSEKNIEIHVSANGMSLNIDKAIPLGLILNELLTNSYKYAFEEKISGNIYVEIKKTEAKYSFVYSDDGVGLDINNLKMTDTLGMRLITRLSHQIGARPIFKNNNGLQLSFYFEI